MIFAVIDTNVLVSALLTSNAQSSTLKVFDAVLKGKIVPLYNKEIIDEYTEVLLRPKFHFSPEVVCQYINDIKAMGLSAERVLSTEVFPDPKDIVFYEVALSKDGAFLVTGNTKHFPRQPIVVTPAEMAEILEAQS